jgi:hypothetical protein
MCFQKFNVIGNRAFDSLRLYVGETMLTGFACGALPCDFRDGRRRREQLLHDSRAIFRKYCPMVILIALGMKIAFGCVVTLNAGNRPTHFERCAPIVPDRIGLPPVDVALLPKALIFAGCRYVFLALRIGGDWPASRRDPLSELWAEGGKLNDLRGFADHDSTA